MLGLPQDGQASVLDPEVVRAGVDALLEFPSDELHEDACYVVAVVFKAMTERQLALRR